ncbi:hypothetical protein [Chamaesiphon sp.]|uniref:hypothetical protein n=1 Tax=Chamaesiphon sp. TaxID=2814140 RepID=UPI003594769C
MPNRNNDPQATPAGDERGRIGADEIQYQRERAAENSGTANGLLIGSLVLALAGIGAVTAYYLNRPAPTPTTIINTPPSPAASVAPAPPKQTTIIDRTVEKTAPPQVKVVEVDKPVIVPVPAPPKVVEVPKPVLVPGATKVIEVPKPVVVPAKPTVTDDSATPSASPAPAPAPAAIESSDSVTAPAPSTP